jgi:hypothetical protein
MKANLHHQQSVAFTSAATEILYGGAAGGGKSHLLRVAAAAWAMMIPGLQVYILRRLSDDLFKNHMTGSGGFPIILSDEFESGHVKWRGDKNYMSFWNGSAIYLGHCQYEKDLRKYQGIEFHVLMLDEATHFTPSMYRFLRGRVRLGGLNIPKSLEGRFPRILMGTNPGGEGHQFFKSEFVDRCKPYEIVQMSSIEGGLKRQFIPAKLSDNPTLMKHDPDYAARLESLGQPHLVRALLHGDWNIVAGGALDDLWGPHLIVPRFKLPSNWKVYRAFDWGTAHPFSVGWWGVSPGEEVMVNGKPMFFPAKSLVRVHEWYGAKDVSQNEGLKLSSVEVAKGILEREKMLKEVGWVTGKVFPGPADKQIYRVNDKISLSVAKSMSDEGVDFLAADMGGGSRLNSFQAVRDFMACSKTLEGSGVWFMDHCNAAITTLPILQRDETNPEDVDTKGLDHVFDEMKYMCSYMRKNFAKKIDLRISY